MLCEGCLQTADRSTVHLGETAVEYLSGVLDYLQKPGDWRLSSVAATLAHALCDNMPRGDIHLTVVPNAEPDGTYRWLCPCGDSQLGFLTMEVARRAGQAHVLRVVVPAVAVPATAEVTEPADEL